MLPFALKGEASITWIQEGTVTVNEAVAKIKLSSGKEQDITLKQR